MEEMVDKLEYICGECHKDMVITPDNFSGIIFYDKRYYHRDCFDSMCERKAKSKRKDIAKKWIDIRKSIPILSVKTTDMLRDRFDRDQVYRFILANYSVNIVPQFIFLKLDEIYKGTFKGMNGCKICAEELLDMWKRQMKNLNNIYSHNCTKGKEMTPPQRISYDLSVLVGKYDSYCTWREKQQRAAEISQSQINKAPVLNTKTYDNIIKQNSKSEKDNSEKVDLESVMNDLFGDE